MPEPTQRDSLAACSRNPFHSRRSPDMEDAGPMRKALFPGPFSIGAGGFEPPASGSQSQRSNQAELHPEAE